MDSNYIRDRTNDILRQKIALGMTGGDYYGGARKKAVKKRGYTQKCFNIPKRRCPKGSRAKITYKYNRRCVKGGDYDGGDYDGGDYDGGDYEGGDMMGMHGMMMPYGGVRAGVLLGGRNSVTGRFAPRPKCTSRQVAYRRTGWPRARCRRKPSASGSKTRRAPVRRKGKKATGLRKKYIEFVKFYQKEHGLSYGEALSEIRHNHYWDAYKRNHGLM